MPSVSLWAAVPHYLPVSANPKAALALVERATSLLGVAVDIEPLSRAAARWEESVARLLEENDELSAYVERLESAADAADAVSGDDPAGGNGGPIPSGEDLALELERYLKEQAGGET
jgi:hypothetical protein